MEQLQLKFRAWDKTHKKWASIGFHLLGETTIFDLLGQYKLENACEDLEFTQFVNLTDKNGEDLCVGDIIQHIDLNMVYEICARQAGYVVRMCLDGSEYYTQSLFELAPKIKKSFVKIGNIYEPNKIEK